MKYLALKNFPETQSKQSGISWSTFNLILEYPFHKLSLDTSEAFCQNEIVLIQAQMIQLNQWIDEEIIRFKGYKVQNIV